MTRTTYLPATTGWVRPTWRFGQSLRKHFPAVLTGLVFAVVGAVGGGYVGNTAISLETVIYSWQETEAELFVTDEYGSLADYPPSQQFVDMGSNRVSFPLTEEYHRKSFVQRLDPCDCPWGIAVGRIGLASPFAYESISPEYWLPGGSIERLIPDANMQLVEIRLPETDPQIVVYMDVARFIERSTVLGALAGAAIAVLALGLGAFLAPRIRDRIREGTRHRAGPPRRHASNKLPVWVAWGAGILVSVSAVQMLAGSFVTGITIDEGYHVGHLQNFLEGRNYSSESYGPVAALVGHGVNVVLGNETWGLVSSAPEAFAGRHLGMALLGALALGAVGLTVGAMIGSWTWGLVGAALLGSLPLWVGHSMFNIKDVPAGSGYALFTAGLVVLAIHRFSLTLRLALGLGFVVCGVLLGIGTRPGLWPLFLASASIALVVWMVGSFLQRSRMSPSARRNYVAGVLGGVLLLLGALLSMLFFTDLGRELSDAVTRSLDHPWSKSRRYAGERVFNRPDALFVFQILLSQMPAAISGLFLTGTATGVFAVARDIRRGESLSSISRVFAIAAVPAFTPFFVVAIFSPVLYDGIRQVLFVLPAVAVIAALGLWGILRSALWLFDSRRIVKTTVSVAAGLVLCLVTVDQLRLFPYNYVYVNVIAQDAGMSGAWESDYWDSSMREAISETVVAGDPITCGFTHQTFWNLGDIRDPCITVSPYLQNLGPESESRLGPREFWTIRSERDLMQYGPRPFNCFPESAVIRMLRFEPLVMSRLYRCIDY